MRKTGIFLICMAFFTKNVFADTENMSTTAAKDSPCASIATACSTAGFIRTDVAGKQFWQDCMKPVILGKLVPGVTVDTATVQACRMSKIEELKSELKELQDAMSAPASG
ncbi:MAG: hypothetical protein JO131_01485 [Gammaproteobacteria bacterium]|nr:hypothetical protein [Gammaproteobacteria bacterium]